ncbi:hypothetical protein BDN67DRAFT_963566 [Paxillus ammoniavirescens]|nr:hypothetical protein BDN67DRAFT_963566 [Paxillus ammoniavirescens]
MDNAMDPELASEMVKLLAQELKVVRAQLRETERGAVSSPSVAESTGLTRERAQALITENESLKADNAALRANVFRLQDEPQWPPIKEEEDVSQASQYEESMRRMREELAEELAEKEELLRQKEKGSRVQQQLSTLQAKHKLLKAEKVECIEVMNELRVELLNCTQELEHFRKVSPSDIDFRSFFEEMPYKPVEEQSELASIQPYSRNVQAKIPKDLLSMCQGPYFMNSNEVIWSLSGIALGLVIKPTVQYNPRSGGGTWTKLNDDFGVGKQMDICYLVGNAWHYIGTYERIGDSNATTIAPETLRHLDRKKVEHVSKQTTLFQDLVPPSQTRMIENMYTNGVIKLQCIGIRCVGFNQAFSQGLLDSFAPRAPEKQKSNKGKPRAKRKASSTSDSTRSKKMRTSGNRKS